MIESEQTERFRSRSDPRASRKTSSATVLLALLLAAAGCAPEMQTPEPVRMAPSPVSLTARDQEVLARVLSDLLSTDAGDSPVARRGVPPERLIVSSRLGPWDVRLEEVLERYDEEAWHGFPASSDLQLRAAGEDLVARARGGAIDFRSTDERVVVREPNEKNATRSDRPIHAWLPGYSSDATLSVVWLTLPWSMHSADATYVLRRSETGWNVIVRQFIYHV